MFSDQIVLRDAVIDSIHYKTEDGKVQGRVQLHASLTQEAGEILGVKSVVFANNGTPKDGFSTLALDTGCAAFRAVFNADPSLKQSFELVSGDSTDRYIVERQAEGHLELKLRLNFHGDPHPALAYIVAVGNAESLLKIVPLQSEIKPAEGDERRPQKNDEYLSEKPVVVSAEAVRQRLTTHRSQGKQTAGVR
jgi:hypothetical protein